MHLSMFLFVLLIHFFCFSPSIQTQLLHCMPVFMVKVQNFLAGLSGADFGVWSGPFLEKQKIKTTKIDC